MASVKQQKPANEVCAQEQPGFWGSKVFGGNKHSTDNQQAAKETHQNSGWWFGGNKQPTAMTTTTTTQHCSTCQCSMHGKNPKPMTNQGVNKKDHTIGVTIMEEQITTKNGKGIIKQSAKTEMKTEERISGKKVDGGNLVHGKNNVCTDVKSNGKKEEYCTIGANSKACTSGGPVKNKEQRENHCFRSMADHMKQRIAMMKSNHAEKYSDSSSSSDSDVEKTEKKKKNKGQSHGTKLTAK